MARAGSSTVGTSETRVFRSDQNAGGTVADGPPAGGFTVTCATASAAPLLVRIPYLHGATSQATLAAGEQRSFVAAAGPGRVAMGHELYLQGSSGTATYTWEAIA